MRNLLFITRCYPPTIGGLEKFSYDWYYHLSKTTQVTLIANKNGKRFLPVFFPYAMFYLIKNGRKFDLIHFGDGLLSPIGILSKLVFPDLKITITIHGLDITYKNRFYQLIISRSLRLFDRIVCVSTSTMNECLSRGLQKSRLVVLPNGLNLNEIKETHLEVELIQKKCLTPLAGRLILITVGRLISRKGHEWFIRNVMPQLPEEYVYLIGGDGAERTNIEKAIKEAGQENRVELLGMLSETEKICLYQNADIFIMPNITIDGDREGFGIVIIEANSYGLPVIASKIDGIPDAVIDGVTGYLVAEKGINEYLDKIISCRLSKVKIKETAINKFAWPRIAQEYQNIFENLIR